MGPEFWLYFAVGFAAQLVDGALGMAYGVVTTTVLLAGGVTPANASASVHAAKVFTGAASAISHIAHRNVDWRLLVLLSTGGVVGGGGWGPVVTSTLLGSGADPRKAIGTTNAAEAFVAAAVSAAFLAALVSGHWETDGLTDHLWSVLGLIGGGVIAAPVAGWMTKVLPLRMLTWIVGLVVTGLAVWQAVILFG